jgi:hypothetical protein
MNADSAIAIVDCNNFYASCERVVNPELQHRPVVVLSHNDGIIVSRSDEVKKLGVPNAAPFFQYRELLERHDTAVISCNHALYFEFSHRVMDVLNEDLGANRLELYSIDEAFADVGTADKLPLLGRHVKNRVFEERRYQCRSDSHERRRSPSSRTISPNFRPKPMVFSISTIRRTSILLCRKRMSEASGASVRVRQYI